MQTRFLRISTPREFRVRSSTRTRPGNSPRQAPPPVLPLYPDRRALRNLTRTGSSAIGTGSNNSWARAAWASFIGHPICKCPVRCLLKRSLQGHPELVGALRDELRKTRPLSHPNIVSAYSINSDEDGDYMLMEYLEGETLQKLLDQEFGRGIPFARAWPLMSDICAALAFAHDHNVIHSDLKPSNVFVTTRGKVKLLDFGIARVARGPLLGSGDGACAAVTESYASCEMLEGGAPDLRDDVYALGCVVYEMLSGRHPFGKRSATKARDLRLAPAPLASLSRRQNAALARALCFDRDARTASVEAFLEQIQPPTVQVRPRVALGAALLVIAAVMLVGRAWLDRVVGSWVARSPAPEAARVHDQFLAHQAAVLNVDPEDSRLKLGLRAYADAQESLRTNAMAEAKASFDKAESSLQEAIEHGARIATVGSTAAEIESALQICREETGNSPDCTAGALADESARKVSLRPFALDRAPVTNAEFAEFIRDAGYVTAAERSNGVYAAAETPVLLAGWSWKTLRDKDLPGDAAAGDFPVRGINYATAKAYCTWRGKRLPTEDEWEFAARGPRRKVFPWGDRVEEAPGSNARRLWPVAKLQPTGAFGGVGLGGLVWEWTDGSGDARPILRGPSYLVNLAFYQRLATRDRENPSHARVDTGLRCAMSVDTWPEVPAGTASIANK